jgi:arylsulfatase
MLAGKAKDHFCRKVLRTALSRLLLALALTPSVAALAYAQQTTGASASGASDKPPYNIVFLIVDQRTYRLLTGADYSLSALDAIASHGVTFKNHYISSAMCSPSRASFLTGQPPQVNGVIDQMEYSFQPSLSPDLPNMGSVLKGLGYKTAYFGKFEMDKEVLRDKPTVNYSAALRPYGFDAFSVGGDTNSAPDSGFHNDTYIAGEGVRWLRVHASESRRTGRPFFMVASFLNPHDIMFGNGNVPGEPLVQKPIVPEAAPPPPANSIRAGRVFPAVFVSYRQGTLPQIGANPKIATQ